MAAPDRGSATVETALALPSMVLLTLALVGVITGVATQIRCMDAARLAARATARGETDGAVRAAVLHELPQAKLTITNTRGLVHVAVSAPLSGLPLLQAFVVHAEAEAAAENGGDDADPG
jgi:Flp pilus assembly protein TadG